MFSTVVTEHERFYDVFFGVHRRGEGSTFQCCAALRPPTTHALRVLKCVLQGRSFHRDAVAEGEQTRRARHAGAH